jgi:thiol-disulfide isomerase/thioredoxin
MFRRNFQLIRIALLVFTVAPVCPAAFKPSDPLPALGSFKLEGKLPDALKGRVVLLDFWASWCGPCRKSFPAMQELHKQYAGRGLTIIAVSVDEKREDMERFLKAENVSFTVVRDAGQKLVAAADVSAIPTSFLIDRAGKIRYVHKGFVGDETVKQYQEQIQLLLKESAPSPAKG